MKQSSFNKHTPVRSMMPSTRDGQNPRNPTKAQTYNAKAATKCCRASIRDEEETNEAKVATYAAWLPLRLFLLEVACWASTACIGATSASRLRQYTGQEGGRGLANRNARLILICLAVYLPVLQAKAAPRVHRFQHVLYPRARADPTERAQRHLPAC